jgi:alpha-L-fucosidase
MTSLQARKLPQWFDGAKLGLMIHWGPYSVPAWAERSGTVQDLWINKGPAYYFTHNPYAEWCVNTMRIPGSAANRYLKEAYGARVSYDDFAARFKEESADANFSDWADICAGAGARYVVLTSKHMDGFLLWPGQQSNPRKQGYHTDRDLVGELTDAVRSRGLRMGLYYCGGYDNTFNPTVIRDLASAVKAIPQSRSYAQYCQAQLTEIIDRYEPSVLWNDIAYPAREDLDGLLAHYYDRVPDGVVNDRWTQFREPRNAVARGLLYGAIQGVSLAWKFLPRSRRKLQFSARSHHDFTTSEYDVFEQPRPRKWEAVRGIGPSFGINDAEREEDRLSSEQIVHLLCDVVSKNGNLLLGIAPHPNGRFPEPQLRRLQELGSWLTVNSEAIFHTKPWRRAEGQTRDGLPVRFTRKRDALYVILLGETLEAEVTIEGLEANETASVQILGSDRDLPWKQVGRDLTIAWPADAPTSPASVIRVSPPPV